MGARLIIFFIFYSSLSILHNLLPPIYVERSYAQLFFKKNMFASFVEGVHLKISICQVTLKMLKSKCL